MQKFLPFGRGALLYLILSLNLTRSWAQVTGSQLMLGPGISQLGTTIALGDSVTGSGFHRFISNRYQYLNGYQYSFGGTGNEPVNHPVFRLYNNADWSAGTTMVRSVNTTGQTGLRYYSKPGYLQIGGSDRLDTTQSSIVYGTWPSSQIFINSYIPNAIQGKVMNGIFASDNTIIDSGIWMENNFIAADSFHFSGPKNTYIRSFFGGYGNTFAGQAQCSMIAGQQLIISKPVNLNVIVGYGNVTTDTSNAATVGGVNNQYGGMEQFVAGQGLVNRTPVGAAVGNYNADFSALPYTGQQGTNVAGIAGYPLFVVGNSASNTGSVHSNAFTVLFNGRTQINTAGHTNNLTQANVTPQAALDVVSTNTGVLFPRLTTVQRNAIIGGDLQNGLFLYNTDSSSFQFYNGSVWKSLSSAANALRWSYGAATVFDSTDNVAIGTSNSQGYSLAVNGSAIFVQIVVKTANNWPDYVFDLHYKLQDLDELDKYIRSNHHLQGVPDQQEVCRYGINIGMQQAAVLKNAEELALDLFRENEELKAQNDRLKAQTVILKAHQQEIDQLKVFLKSLK